jgi:hypothetical protein
LMIINRSVDFSQKKMLIGIIGVSVHVVFHKKKNLIIVFLSRKLKFKTMLFVGRKVSIVETGKSVSN